MTDILIRNVPGDDLARIDEHAARLGLSRGDYLRRRIAQDAQRSPAVVTVADFEHLSDIGRDLLDDEVMRGAWS